MAKLYLICGKVCSGKTHYARALQARTGAVLFSCDELILRMFPEDLGDRLEEISAAAREYLLARALETVRAGAGAILDWGFWDAAARAAVTARAREVGCACEWHYIDVSDAVWAERIRTRNARIARGEALDYLVDEGLRAKCLDLFVPPDPADMDVWVRDGA